MSDVFFFSLLYSMLFSSIRALGLSIDFHLACGSSVMVLEMLVVLEIYACISCSVLS